MLTPFDLTQPSHGHLRGKAAGANFRAESWGETKLTALLAKHPEARQAFPALLLPDIGGDVHEIRRVITAPRPPAFARVAFDDVARFVNGLVWFWQNAYQLAVPGEQPSSVEELLSEARLNLLATHLNLDAGPMVTPPRTWWEEFDRHFCDMTDTANTILQRHLEHRSS